MRACPEKSLSDWMRATMEAKRTRRRELATLPIDEKIKLLERMRDRALAIAASPLRREVQSRAAESVKVFPRPGQM